VAALQETFPLHAPHDVGERRAVDARTVDQPGLAQSLVVRHRDEHGELPRRQVAVLHFRMEDISCTLTSSMQKMDG